MTEREILNALSNLNDEEAKSIAEAMFLGQTSLGKAVQRYIELSVSSSMILWAAKEPGVIARFKELTGNIMKVAVQDTAKHFEDSSELPLRSFYSEEQACQFFQKGPQFLKTRRSKGQSVPKHIDTGSGFIYSIAELLRFSDEIGPSYESVSKDVLMEKGLEAISVAVGNISRKIEARQKSRTPKKE